MATDVSIVMVYRDFGDQHRQASYGYVRARYEAMGYEFILDQSDGGRAAAINSGVKAAAGNIIVQVDSDSLVPREQIEKAVGLAAEEDGLVVPHSRYLYLTKAATAQIYTGRDPFTFGPGDCEQVGPGVGNAVVFSRSTWQRAGGYDERMRLGDDAAFAYACHAFTGDPRRVPGDVVHFWHPRPTMSVPGTRAYVDEFVRVAEYRDAAAEGHEAVRKYVASR